MKYNKAIKHLFYLLFLSPFFCFGQTQECITQPTQQQIDYLNQNLASLIPGIEELCGKGFTTSYKHTILFLQLIETIKKDNEVLIRSQKENVNEKQLLKKDYKNLFNKNMKLADGNKKLADGNKKLADGNKKLKILIQSLEQQVKEQETLIKKLDDTSHH